MPSSVVMLNEVKNIGFFLLHSAMLHKAIFGCFPE